MIEILATGALATVQDLGRPGWAALGVPRSGAFDRGAARLANRLVGNSDDTPLIESTFGGLVVRVLDAATVALTGAACPGFEHNTAVSLPAGAIVRLGAPATGLRSYLAVRGGLDLAATLGSCSTDLLSGLGPARLAAGDRVPVGTRIVAEPSGVSAAPAVPTVELPMTVGPRADWFTRDAIELLTAADWSVRAESDRVGVRLDGPPLPRARHGELPSEPTRPGAVQVPTDGRPIVFGPDAPVTGGYPVIAVVDDVGLDIAAQLRPGQTVRFRRESGAGWPT